MKEIFLTELRDRSTSCVAFREAARRLARILAAEAAQKIPAATVQVTTPLASAPGKELKNRVILVPILRAGLTLLEAFEDFFPAAPIGFFGIRRDEQTAAPRLYYENLPVLTKEDWVIVLDPMLATGGSASLAIQHLGEKGASFKQMMLVSVVAAQQGVDVIQTRFPDVIRITGAIDPKLNDKKFIVPGLGDFGDRFFGTEALLKRIRSS